MKNIIDALEWREATKQFDSSKKLTTVEEDMLLESLRLAPSSFGLQPWKFVIVTNDEVRAKLRAAAWNQPQVTDASHLIVLSIKKDINAALVNEYIELTAKVRGVKAEDLKGFSDMLNGSISGMTPEQSKNWATRQVYLSLGVLLTAAAVEGIDACPMEGFDPKQFDEILGLDAMGLESKVIVALGFRTSGEQAAVAPKVRFSKEEVFVEVK